MIMAQQLSPDADSLSQHEQAEQQSGISGGAAIQEPSAEPSIRSLRRSRDDRVIAGVCGGAGRYLGIDPVVLRLALVALAIGAGTGVLLYIVLWIVIPEAKPGDDLGPAPVVASKETMQWVIGGGLVLIGFLLLAGRIIPWWDSRLFWPAVLIVIGLFVLAKGVRR
jgi:phage shock protein C